MHGEGDKHPHICYGCDFCPDGARILGAIRYHRGGQDVDCCALCYRTRVPRADRDAFVKIGGSPDSLAPVPQLAAAVPPMRYELRLNPKPGSFQQRVEGLIRKLAPRHGVAAFRCDVAIASGFSTRSTADAAAHAAVAAFRTADGAPIRLVAGRIDHEPRSPGGIAVRVRPAAAFEAAAAAAEDVKRRSGECGCGSMVSVWPAPHIMLLHGDMTTAAELDDVIASVGGHSALEDSDFEPGAVAVWQHITSVNERSQEHGPSSGPGVSPSSWSKVFEAVV
jgi:hypothetical protein